MIAVGIRFAAPDESTGLEQLQFRASIALPTYREDVLRHPEVIHLPPSLIVQKRVRVAVHASVTVGFIALLAPEDSVSKLDGLFVDPAWWRQGIGSALIRDACDLARAEHTHAIHVVANPDALEFYHACGFITVGETQTQFGPAPRMRCVLSGRR